jgi:hypothetical protein
MLDGELVMKKSAFSLSLVLVAVSFAPSAFAQKKNPELNNPLPGHFPDKARFVRELAGKPTSGGSNLSYHTGGPIIANAKVVPIFWGSAWSGSSVATSLTSYVAQFGNNGEYNTITQYYQILNGTQTFISKSSLGANAVSDNSNPPTNVTDAAIQAEVKKLFPNPDPNTIYEVFLPAASYSSNGSSTSCGGPNLQYCAYHGNFSFAGKDVKYASMPYPSCGGCQTAGFSVAQNFEHFVSHETREAVTDPDLNAWFDRRGYEADDKCAWSPTPFADATTGTNADGSGYAYQYEWSNAASGCVKTK